MLHDNIVDTVELFPHHFLVPQTSSKDQATIAAQELAEALLYPALDAPFAHLGDGQMVSLQQLAALFSSAFDYTSAAPKVAIPSPQ
jgi:hypothetical protein